MGNLLQDVRYGFRMLLKNPGFTFVAALALALGIGANTAIFSVVNTVLLRPLPFDKPDRIVAVYGTSAKDATEQFPLSYPDFVDYRSQTQTLEHIAGYVRAGSLLKSGDGTVALQGAVVSADLFPLLGVKPVVGRVFTNEEDKKGAAPVVVLSYGLWQRHFNSDPKIVGREITLSGRSVSVVGVMPQGFKFPAEDEKSEFWMPLESDPGTARFLDSRGSRFFRAIGSLKPGVTIQQSETEMNTIARRLETEYADSNTDARIQLVSLQEDIVGKTKPALLILLGAVGLVLLIACANVANLLLARATARVKEMAIRTALGASRGRVVRQMLTESLLLSLVGGTLGLLLAMWGVDLLVKASPAELPRIAEVSLDSHVLVFTLLVTALTGIIFGLAPALQAARLNLNESLKEGGRTGMEGAGRSRVRSLLVISEVALSLVLLIGAGLLIKSFWRLLQTDPGYDTKRVLALDVTLPRVKYPEPERQAAFFQQALQRIAALPGVEAAGATNLLPLGGGDRESTFKIEGYPIPAHGEEPDAMDQIISPDYFRAMGIPLRTGRFFTEHDTKESPQVIIVNEMFVRRYLQGVDPLTKRILLDTEGDNPTPRQIVGVVGDVRHDKLDAQLVPGYYVPYLQSPARRMDVVVRSVSQNPSELAASVRNAIKEVDPDQFVWETRTMGDLLSRSVAPRRFNMMLLGCFALIALILASVGIYGVMAYYVTQRTHEIGIRMALGAKASDVLRLVVRQGMLMALIGIASGLIVAFALTRVMTSLLYEVSATDPLIFAGISLLFIVVSLLASYIPARRATKVDPMVALRYE
ncbi:MAG TPA: ABC transporter permease [Pyrinomonadaceae bacterium]|nr:ABC transporter permease [Pyrinomonadaceae bacterium]